MLAYNPIHSTGGGEEQEKKVDPMDSYKNSLKIEVKYTNNKNNNNNKKDNKQ